jgi:hypothetical protein
MWRWVTTKPEGVSEGTTSTVDIARDHHSNDNNNTEEQTYGLFCCSFRFTQTRPRIYRTEWFARLQCVMISYIMYKDECLFVCLENIQIHISKPLWTKLSTHRLLGLEVVFQLSHLFDLFCRKRFPIRAQKLAAGAKVSRYCVITVMRRVFLWRHGRETCIVGNA